MEEPERKTLVKSESELMVGSLIEFTGCMDCEGKHRALVVDIRQPEDFTLRQGKLVANQSLKACVLLPRPKCNSTPYVTFNVAIEEGRLWMIETSPILGLELNPYSLKWGRNV